MKEFEINTKSWHYKFQYYTYSKPYNRTDICSYGRGFLWSLIKVVLGPPLVAFTLLLISFMGLNFWYNGELDSIDLTWGNFFFGLLVILGFVSVVITGIVLLGYSIVGAEKAKHTAVGEWYSNFKAKTCTKVKFK